MGLTLFGEMREKIIASVVSGQRITTAWWNQLRLKWQRVNAPEASLSVKNPNYHVAPPDHGPHHGGEYGHQNAQCSTSIELAHFSEFSTKPKGRCRAVPAFIVATSKHQTFDLRDPHHEIGGTPAASRAFSRIMWSHATALGLCPLQLAWPAGQGRAQR